MSIDVMKQALETLEKINKLSVGENAVCLPAEIDGAMDALRQAIEQAEKHVPETNFGNTEKAEPVTYIGMIDEEHFKDVCRKANGKSNTPLFAHPAREPLTDEEIGVLAMDSDGTLNSHLEFARAIEAAHGIKESTA